jgi:WD40 repeat protein
MVSVNSIPTEELDTDHLCKYIDRINASVENDPSLAIGSMKDLIEATLKTILNGCSYDYDDKQDDIPKLLKKVQKVLKLAPNDVDESSKGSDIIKKVLNNLGTVAVGIAELRNLYGSGHGKGEKIHITPRHAKLVIGSGTALCNFLLETYKFRSTINLEHLKIQSWQSLPTLSFNPPGKVRCVAFHPNNQILASGDECHMVRVWKLDTGEVSQQYERYYYEQNSGDVTSLTFSHDGKFIISTGFVSGAGSLQGLKQRKIQFLDWENGEIVASLPNSSRFDRGNSIVLCPGRNIVAFDSSDNIELYDFSLGQPSKIKTLTGHINRINTVAFSPDGKTLVSGSEDGQVRICDWQTTNALEEYAKIAAAINSVGISANSQLLAIGSKDSKILLLNLKSGQKHIELEGHLGAVCSLMFSPDGQFLASGSKDDTVKIWHVKTGELLHSFEGGSCWPGVLSLSFSQDGQILAAGLEGGEIKVWQKN